MNDGKFKKGNIPWNKDLKKIRLSPKSEFKVNQHAGEKHPQWKGGVHNMSKDCVHLYTDKYKRVRKPRKIYEDAHGPIPKGYIIVHLDGDRYNDSLFNLEAISRAENLKRNREKSLLNK